MLLKMDNITIQKYERKQHVINKKQRNIDTILFRVFYQPVFCANLPLLRIISLFGIGYKYILSSHSRCSTT